MINESTYWKVSGYVFEFIYRYADCKYYEMPIDERVDELIKAIGSKANPHKVKARLYNIFKKATYCFDLPEHPEKHNGFYKSEQYQIPVMAALGFTFGKQLITPNNPHHDRGNNCS